MEIKITDNVTDKDIDEIYQQLKKFNLSKMEPSEEIPLGVFMNDDNGVKKAGLTGETFGNWLCIKYLWVSEDLRGRGIGSQLLQAAESEAMKRGAKYVFVDTFSFQAPEFYRKHGYEEVFQLYEYPYSGSRSYFTKKI
ncbi:GNAT family N-acetyltransferase [Blautia sp. HCP3S3_G3]|uniref:GNAT family N-acetyltransferase n=1 Tax=Blautia sp. HCP3S3_G3 TaxID=3438913 RepID=UPI003F8944B4